MPFEFRLPDIGEGVTEGEIVAWHTSAGEAIAEDDTMVEVMTDKATVTIPSPVTGTVLATHGDVGDVMPVGAVLVEIETGATAATPAEEKAEDEAARPAQPPDAPVARPGRVLATPATRRRARERGVDLATVAGTGKDGRVTREDVDRAAEGEVGQTGRPVEVPPRPVQEVLPALPPADPTATAPPRPASGLEARVRIPIRGLRRRISEKMAQAWSHAAHFTFVEEADASRLVELRRRMNRSLEEEGLRLSFLPFIVKAVVAALKRHPHINAWIDDEAGEIVQHSAAHIGIATATDGGLLVPVVHDAGRLSLKQLAMEIQRLAEATRAGRATREELSGSTLSITSLGQLGGLLATPILNYPEVAILGVHRMRRRPLVVEGDRIEPRDVLPVSASFDHRVIDGHVGAAFVYEVIRYLEDPDLLFLELV